MKQSLSDKQESTEGTTRGGSYLDSD